jgi:hypothetical protein
VKDDLPDPEVARRLQARRQQFLPAEPPPGTVEHAQSAGTELTRVAETRAKKARTATPVPPADLDALESLAGAIAGELAPEPLSKAEQSPGEAPGPLSAPSVEGGRAGNAEFLENLLAELRGEGRT